MDFELTLNPQPIDSEDGETGGERQGTKFKRRTSLKILIITVLFLIVLIPRFRYRRNMAITFFSPSCSSQGNDKERTNNVVPSEQSRYKGRFYLSTLYHQSDTIQPGNQIS